MYEIRVFCFRSAVELPQWVNDWSIDTLGLEDAIREKKFDGGKTLNLYQLIDDLVSASFRISKPEIGRLYVNLDVR
jgi:hypothetical protein